MRGFDAGILSKLVGGLRPPRTPKIRGFHPLRPLSRGFPQLLSFHNIMKHSNHYVIMFFIMLLSGLLSTMNVWVDKVDDIRFSINDAYMTLLMSGWMFLFMGLIYKEIYVFFIGLECPLLIFIHFFSYIFFIHLKCMKKSNKTRPLLIFHTFF